MARPGLYANIHAKENVAVKCVKKVQRVHQKHLTLNEQNKQRGKNND